MAYLIGMTSELHDREGLFDGSIERIENDPTQVDFVSGEIWEGYVIPDKQNEVAGEVSTTLDEWETIAHIWDNIRATYPGNYIVHIDHKDANMWEATLLTSTMPPKHVTYLVKGDRVERMNA